VSKETYYKDLKRGKRYLIHSQTRPTVNGIPEEGKVNRNLVPEIVSHISDRFVEALTKKIKSRKSAPRYIHVF